MAVDFLEENNVAGQLLLRVVSRGNAIIAELLRLSDNIPPIFILDDKDEFKKFGDVVLDGRYRDNPDLYEARIEGSEELLELEEEFWFNNEAICTRFYQLFDSIFKYVSDILVYLRDLNAGVFLQHTLEGILFDKDGKQLMSEALYLYGATLLLMDYRIPGIVRERVLIAYYRHKSDKERPNWDEVWRLCRSTGYVVGGRKPGNYPEEFFARVELPVTFVDMVVSRLRSDDIYSQTVEFPDPSHRSTALSTQARMLYVILYFIPHLLNEETATMREIVDRHFSDNWVIAFYMGYTVDLSVAWEPYKAARLALSNTLQPTNMRQLATRHSLQVNVLMITLKEYLTEGVLTEEYVLDNIPTLLATLRQCNVTIRWLMLHLTTRAFKKEIAALLASPDQILSLTLDTAQFEFILKRMFTALLDKKKPRWDQCKTEANNKLVELAEYFSGQQALAKGVRDENLDKWFKERSAQVNALDFSDSTLTGRKLQQLMQALEDVEDFHQIDTSLQVKQFLMDIRNLLQQMIRTANIKETVLVTLSLISDMSYGWHIIDDYTELMHRRITQDSFVVLKLRATFQKLATVLDLPLVRIVQANSPDAVSVSQYYSQELVAFVRKVMQIIPLSMFRVLEKITELLTYSLHEPTARIVKTDLREFAQLDLRRQLAKHTHRVSVLTEGILAMESTLVGVIEVNFKEVLEDGIRKELVNKITQAMHESLTFNPKTKDFEQRLKLLAGQLDGLRTAFEYISDYIKVYGLRVWQEEYSRICNFMVQQECNKFLKNKIYPWQSEYQSLAIPIPVYRSPERDTDNFMGRLTREILRQVDPLRVIYVDALSGFYDPTGREVVSLSTFALLNRSVGTIGLAGVDKLLCFMVVRYLQTFIGTYKKALVRKPEMVSILREVASSLEPLSGTPGNAALRVYTHMQQKMARYLPVFAETVVKVGISQLIRRMINNELNFSCKLDSNHLYCCLDVFNKALIHDVRQHYENPDKPYPGAGDEDNPILSNLSLYLDWAGISHPISKIYLTSEPLDHFPLMVFILVISQMGKFVYDPRLCSLVSKDKKEVLDGPSFVVGVITVLKQFHSAHTTTFLAYLGQYIRCHVVAAFSKDPKPTELPTEATNVLLFLEEFCKYSKLKRQVLDDVLPSFVFDNFKRF